MDRTVHSDRGANTKQRAGRGVLLRAARDGGRSRAGDEGGAGKDNSARGLPWVGARRLDPRGTGIGRLRRSGCAPAKGEQHPLCFPQRKLLEAGQSVIGHYNVMSYCCYFNFFLILFLILQHNIIFFTFIFIILFFMLKDIYRWWPIFTCIGPTNGVQIQCARVPINSFAAADLHQFLQLICSYNILNCV